MSKQQIKFGVKVRQIFGYDVYQAPLLTQSIWIHRLEFDTSTYYQPSKEHFSTVRLAEVVMYQHGTPRVGKSGERLGIEPYALSSNCFDKVDAKFLWLNQWRPESRIEVSVRNLNEEGTGKALQLLSKAQEFSETGWDQLHKDKFKDITGDDFLWANLDIFTRLMLGLYMQDVKLIWGNLQDFQMWDAFQFKPSTIRSMWDTSNMLRGLSDEELAEGARSA